eukprot:2981960-Rhodomonas_salina.1
MAAVLLLFMAAVLLPFMAAVRRYAVVFGWGCSAVVFKRCNAAVYGGNTALYRGNTAIHDSNAAVYGGNTAVYGRKAAIYGRKADGAGAAAPHRRPLPRPGLKRSDRAPPEVPYVLPEVPRVLAEVPRVHAKQRRTDGHVRGQWLTGYTHSGITQRCLSYEVVHRDIHTVVHSVADGVHRAVLLAPRHAPRQRRLRGTSPLSPPCRFGLKGQVQGFRRASVRVQREA